MDVQPRNEETKTGRHGLGAGAKMLLVLVYTALQRNPNPALFSYPWVRARHVHER